jgi:hypothetical protein
VHGVTARSAGVRANSASEARKQFCTATAGTTARCNGLVIADDGLLPAAADTVPDVLAHRVAAASRAAGAFLSAHRAHRELFAVLNQSRPRVLSRVGRRAASCPVTLRRLPSIARVASESASAAVAASSAGGSNSARSEPPFSPVHDWNRRPLTPPLLHRQHQLNRSHSSSDTSYGFARIDIPPELDDGCRRTSSDQNSPTRLEQLDARLLREMDEDVLYWFAP